MTDDDAYDAWREAGRPPVKAYLPPGPPPKPLCANCGGYYGGHHPETGMRCYMPGATGTYKPRE